METYQTDLEEVKSMWKLADVDKKIIIENHKKAIFICKIPKKKLENLKRCQNKFIHLRVSNR